MSKSRHVVLAFVLASTLAVSAFAEEQPRSTRHARSFVEEIILWIMDGLSCPPG